uniref:Zinc transporter ZIP1-like n=1 Tax=Saccoglossus kowalevskii TaxID=10224 RepID=A0ABM0GYH3_SACKO|nr:PREDICTED: zinc transporter ZIP1-like [Saccoglossus kowalevskii]
MDSLIWIKVVVLVGLLLVVMVFGLLPLKLATILKTKRLGSARILRLLSCFAGGVFLATCLLDLLPEVTSQFDAVFERMNVQMNFPITGLVVTIGFLLILAVEEVVLGCKESQLISANENVYTLGITVDDSRGDSDDTDSLRETKFVPEDTDFLVAPTYNFSNSLRSMALLVALSLHSLFEGLAIGLRNESSGVLRLFTAVAIHKSILAFSLGLKLVQSNLSLRTVVLSCLFFAVTSPLGVSLGILCQSMASELTSAVITATLQAIATGTLFYITFLEVLANEINSNGDRFWKVVAVIVGVVCMTGLVMFGD